MKLATYNKKTGEVASPMDAYIAEVENADKELELEKEGKQEKEKENQQGEVSTRPSQLILHQQLHIYDDDKISTFCEKQDEDTTSSNQKLKWIPPSPMEVTPSTISNSTSIAFTPAQMEQK